MKARGVSLAVLAAVLGASAGRARADDEVGVDDVIAMYREHAPRVAAARAQIDVTAADRVEATIYPNPTLSFGGLRTVQGEPTSGRNQFSAGLDVPVLIGHQRARRGDAAAARIEVTRRGVAVDEASAEVSIREKFLALQGAQQRTATLAAAVEDAIRARAVVTGRVAAGASSPYALERVELAVATASSKVDEARADERAHAAELAAAIGRAGWIPHARTTLADDEAAAPAAPAATPAGIAPDHPLLALAQAEAVAARAEASRAEADAVPTPSVGLTAFSTTGPEGLALLLGVSVPLATSDRNQGQIARAHAQEQAARLETEADRAELAAQRTGAMAVLALRREALARYRADMLARLPKVREMAESAYRSGQGGIVELLDAIDAITEAKLREVDLLAAVAEAELAVRTATTGR